MTAKTQGISPKLIVAVLTAVITYVLGQEVLDLSPLVVVIGQAVLIALAVFAASPGLVEPENPFTKDPIEHFQGNDHQYGVLALVPLMAVESAVSLLLYLLVAVVVIFLIVQLLKRL